MRFLQRQFFKLQLLFHIAHFSFELAHPTLQRYRFTLIFSTLAAISSVALLIVPLPSVFLQPSPTITVPLNEDYKLVTYDRDSLEVRATLLQEAIDSGVTNPAYFQNLYLIYKALNLDEKATLLHSELATFETTELPM